MSQGQYGLNKVKASAFRRWPVLSPYRGVQTTRLTGGHDLYLEQIEKMSPVQRPLHVMNLLELGQMME